jgi:hypothetical protein
MALDFSPDWLLLVVSLPTPNATARMRIWRNLKALGCMALRDGAYLLPAGGERERALEELAEECIREGGSAWLMAIALLAAQGRPGLPSSLRPQRGPRRLAQGRKQSSRSLTSLSSADLARLRRRLQREFETLRAIDFFPGEASVEADAAWAELTARIERLLSPDEPHETRGQVPRLDLARYQGRTWATRRRPWVDRVASAWLIRRFIDPKARFRWLASPSDCPKSALGFDFDSATFTHVGERVTFETLMASFGLEDDAALQRLAAMVHQLDVGGEPVPEASGFEAVLAGARERLTDDDKLLAEMSAVLDSLHAHFGREAARSKS